MILKVIPCLMLKKTPLITGSFFTFFNIKQGITFKIMAHPSYTLTQLVTNLNFLFSCKGKGWQMINWTYKTINTTCKMIFQTNDKQDKL